MSKQDFIALADAIREHNRYDDNKFTAEQIGRLASFCRGQNNRFMQDRWVGYIAGENGPNGGAIKKGERP